MCITDKRPCCDDSKSEADWFYPDGRTVSGSSTLFNVQRSFNGEVSLYRISNNVTYPTGRFCCRIPDDINRNQTLCVNLGESKIP